ncbi:MAG: hypothetical protein Q4C82_02450 [Eubacteriales bacterium]|nr:hypothetical protein [Eubacteriales bacterium]
MATLEEVKKEVREANLVLVGLGEELSGDPRLWKELAGLLKNKDYFIVTLKDRAGLEAAGLDPERITAPLQDPGGHKSWEDYLRWLSFTLHQRLCVLELGAGFAHPQLIRFPFEKTAYFNKKARYIRISGKFPQLSEEIADRGIPVREDPERFFAGMTGRQPERTAGETAAAEQPEPADEAGEAGAEKEAGA